MSDAAELLDTAIKLAQLTTLVVGGGTIIFRMSRMATTFELIGKQQAKEISEVKSEVRELSKTVTELAVQKTRLDNQAERLNLLDKRYEELRHGEGFVFPLDAHLSKRVP